MLNRVVMVGRMTRDPELRRTASGAAVTSFTVALNRNFNSADGQQADFIPCVVWNKVAENVDRYCSKGSLVGIEGRLRSRSYDNNQGQKVFVVEVVCDSVQFLESKGARERNQQQDNFYEPMSPETTMPSHTNEHTMNPVELEQKFDNSANTFDIMEDDIQF